MVADCVVPDDPLATRAEECVVANDVSGEEGGALPAGVLASEGGDCETEAEANCGAVVIGGEGEPVSRVDCPQPLMARVAVGEVAEASASQPVVQLPRVAESRRRRS